jgi:hypothetical protein
LRIIVMASEQRRLDPSGKGDHRIIPFRPRATTNAPKREPQPPEPKDLSAYERDRDPDDYRHRMMMNVAAGIFTIALTGFGIWLAMSIADLRKTTDCLLIGRRDCAVMPVHHR